MDHKTGIDEVKWISDFGVFFHARRLEILKSMIIGEHTESALDVGSGSGLLSSLGINSVSFDVTPHSGVTLVASAEALPFRDSSFSLIFAGEVIEHLRHPKRALRDWIRVLKTDGTLIISTPNGILVRVEGNRLDHIFTFSPNGLEEGLRGLGLSVESIRTIYTGLFGKRVFRFLPKRSKMSILRFPVPRVLSYDIFIKSRKERTVKAI